MSIFKVAGVFGNTPLMVEGREVEITDFPMIPNIDPNGYKAFPHQAEALKNLDDLENLGVIDVDMGGGKAWIITCDIMNHLNKGNITKPLWIMPGNTIAQQMKEVEEKYSDGKINCMDLTNSVYNQAPTEKIVEAIRNAPPNTIFMTSYDFLNYAPVKPAPRGYRLTFVKVQDKEFVIGGPKWKRWVGPDEKRPGSVNEDGFWDYKLEMAEIDAAVEHYRKTGLYKKKFPIIEMSPEQLRRTKVLEKFRANYQPDALAVRGLFRNYWWKAHLLLDSGVDYVCLDESQRAKSPDSITHKACMALTQASVRRIASGTTVPNTPLDLYWQMQFIAPDLLATSQSDFEMKYGKEWSPSGGGVIKWKETALKDIRDKIVNSGGSSMRRSRWRYLLPKKRVTMHKAEMAPEVQKLYDTVLKSELDNIFQDPVLVEKMKGMDEDELGGFVLDDRILQQLTRLDKFVSAPEFDKDPTISKLASEFPNAKVEIIDRIIASHGIDNPDAGKILIFGSYKDIAQAIKDLSKYSSRMLYYDASKKKNLDEFTDPENRKIMILASVDQSLREGHNMQFVSRMIRVSIPWSPGPMEQAWGRAFRTGSKFETVDQDIIVMDNSIEVPKFQRIVYKRAMAAAATSDYVPTPQHVVGGKGLEPVEMNRDTLEVHTNYDLFLPPYVTEMHKMEKFEEDEGERDKEKYGTEQYDVASGEDIKGTAKLEKLKLIPGLKKPLELPRCFNPDIPTHSEVRTWLSHDELPKFLPQEAMGQPPTDKGGIEQFGGEIVKKLKNTEGLLYTFIYKADGEKVTVVRPNESRVIISVKEADEWIKQLTRSQGYTIVEESRQA